MLDFEPRVLCALPMPGAVYPPVPEAGISVCVMYSLLPPLSTTQLRICRLPASQHSGFQSKSLLQLTSSGWRKQACCLWCLSTNLSPTSLRAGPWLLLCVVSFFPMAAPAGLWSDNAITCFGSRLWHYSQGCQHTSPLPSFSDAKVFSLIETCFL